MPSCVPMVDTSMDSSPGDPVVGLVNHETTQVQVTGLDARGTGTDKSRIR